MKSAIAGRARWALMHSQARCYISTPFGGLKVTARAFIVFRVRSNSQVVENHISLAPLPKSKAADMDQHRFEQRAFRRRDRHVTDWKRPRCERPDHGMIEMGNLTGKQTDVCADIA